MKKATALLWLALASQTIGVQAATITTGVVNVLGTDLTFHMLSGGSFESIWDTEGDSTNGLTLGTATSAPYFWGNAAGAFAARDALMAFYGLTDTWNGTYDSFLIPHAADSPISISVPDTSNFPAVGWAWATFEAAPAAVPEPALAAPIFLSGLVIPFAYRRRRQLSRVGGS